MTDRAERVSLLRARAVTRQQIVGGPARPRDDLQEARERTADLVEQQSKTASELRELRERVAASQAEIGRLNRVVISLQAEDLQARTIDRAMEFERRIGSRVGSAEVEVQELRVELERVRRRLDNSPSQRLIRVGLRSLGSLSRLVSALAALVMAAFDSIVRRRYRPQLSGLQQAIGRSNGTWLLDGEDSQILLAKPLPRGPAEVRLRASSRTGGEPILYLDKGHGFSELHRVSLGTLSEEPALLRRVVDFTGVRAVRLDPSAVPGEIDIHSLDLVCVSLARLVFDSLRHSRVLRIPSAIQRSVDGLRHRVYRPVLTPLQDVVPIEGEYGGWRTTGVDAQLLVDGRLPQGWAEVSITGHADPPTLAALYLDRGEGFGEANAYRLGFLTTRSARRVAYVPFNDAVRARLDPSTEPGIVHIEKLEFRSISIWQVAWRAAKIYMSRHPTQRDSPQGFWLWSLRVLLESGPSRMRRELAKQLRYHDDIALYGIWLEEHPVTSRDTKTVDVQASSSGARARISIALPVYNPNETWLRKCIDSVRAQIYEDWELCIADDASTKSSVRKLLNEVARADPRIKVTFRERNGHIAAATNTALELATGDFVTFIDQDDQLTQDALLQVALTIERNPNVQILYSDEDKITISGTRYEPYFKPDWSPEFLMSQNYIGHLSVYRHDLVRQLGGLRDAHSGSQDYDLALRATELTDQIIHVPLVLYHWRAVPGSVAAGQREKDYARKAAVSALADALRRRGLSASVTEYIGHPGHYAVSIEPKGSPKVSIVVPTRDRSDLLERCLKSVFDLTTYPNFDVCIVDNRSRESSTFDLIKHWQAAVGGRLKMIRGDIDFNFPHLVNAGVTASDGDLVVLLNNDTEVVTPNWLERMAGYAQLPGVGAVGCKLLYPDGTIQHAGVVLVGGVAGHSHKGYPADSAGYFGRLLGSSNYSAITAACVMLSRNVFDRVGGFDPRLPVAFNDVDFCLRAMVAGYRHVCLSDVVLMHHESKSRGHEDTPEKRARFNHEVELMRRRWAPLLDRDPYYSPHLTRFSEDFAISPLATQAPLAPIDVGALPLPDEVAVEDATSVA
jgi:GT2 family glycosyltransferase